jgi:hypothetical protein
MQDFCSNLQEKLVSEKAALRIRDVYPGSEFFPSRIRIKEFKYFNPKMFAKFSEV